jgi:hypothetical protein
MTLLSQAENSGKRGRSFAFTILFAILISLLGLGIGIFSGRAGQGARQTNTLEIEQQIQNLLRLHTAEHIYKDIIYVGETSSFLGFTTRDRHLLFSIQLHVLAGIDVQNQPIVVSRGDSAIASSGQNSGILQIELPAAEIIAIQADESSIHEFLASGRGRPLGMLRYFDEIAAAKETAAQDARARGLLEQAEANARILVKNMIAPAEDIIIEFRAPQSETSETGDANDS